MNPLISVIIPTYNCEKTIGRAIESMLYQTYRNLEIIVVDDFSTDKTLSVVLEYSRKDSRVRLIKAEFDDPNRINKKTGRNINAGYSARNTGFKHAKGDFITFQDADDASFKNRIEVQYRLLIKHNAGHVTLDWQKFNERYIGKGFDAERFMNHHPGMLNPCDIMKIANKSKGLATKILGPFFSKIDFELKRMRFVNKFFFGSIESYPGTGNSPLFKREIIDRVKFRKLDDRIWPSFVGRGADRDFNFQVAETFKSSYVFFVPMYMWRQNKQNEKYMGNLEKYIID